MTWYENLSLERDIYTASKNGGLGLKMLSERYIWLANTTPFPTFLRDDDTKDFAQWQLYEKEKKRDNRHIWSLFFQLGYNVIKQIKGRSHSVILELFMVANEAKIGNNYDESTMW
jgi:hypothetical protein